jgi:hypothetical protein
MKTKQVVFCFAMVSLAGFILGLVGLALQLAAIAGLLWLVLTFIFDDDPREPLLPFAAMTLSAICGNLVLFFTTGRWF